MVVMVISPEVGLGEMVKSLFSSLNGIAGTDVGIKVVSVNLAK